jgi:hypothetical protein
MSFHLTTLGEIVPELPEPEESLEDSELLRLIPGFAAAADARFVGCLSFFRVWLGALILR